jgi:hypothetical protein
MLDQGFFFKQLLKLSLIYLTIMAELGFLSGIHAWQRLGF